MSRVAAMIVIVGFAINVSAQTATDAVDALKDGAAKSSAKDYLGAIESFKKCISIYDELGETENENRITAISQIPSMQNKQGLALYKAKKYDESVAAFETLKEYAVTYENAKMAKKAKSTIPLVYYAKGASLLKTKDYSNAIVALDKSIELNPKYPMSYVRKAQVYKAQDDEVNFKASVDGAISTSIAKRDSKTEGTAKKLASSYYLKAGASAVKSEKYSEAEKHFNTLMEYKDVNSDIYFQLMIIYNKQTKWADAIKSGNKAIELLGADAGTKDAKVYYELGNSHIGNGDNISACDAYKKALKGDYEASAKYQIEVVLKCK